MVEEIITALSRIRWLPVTAHPKAAVITWYPNGLKSWLCGVARAIASAELTPRPTPEFAQRCVGVGLGRALQPKRDLLQTRCRCSSEQLPAQLLIVAHGSYGPVFSVAV
jgi:hypothetical protein